MKPLISLLLTIFCVSAGAQNFVRYYNAPINVNGDNAWASSWGDYDNDGFMDLYVSGYLRPNVLFHNNGNKTFTKITNHPLVTSTVGHWSSTWVDFDDDGDLDMYVVNSYTSNNELFRNNGNGTFTNIASVITNTDATDDNNASWVDTDNDGDLDLYLANGSNSTDETRNQNNSFYINNGNGTFTQNTTSAITKDGGFSDHAAFGDYDNDNDLDLIVVNLFGVNFFYENKGNNTFERILGLPFLSTGDQPRTAVWGDFNNDTYVDLVIGSYTDSRIYYNNGDKTFHTGTFPTIGGNAAGLTTGDFNLDGYLDVLFIRTSQAPLLYINNGNETFTKTNAGDLTLTTCNYTNSGAVADYDNDGDLDVFINNDDGPNLLFENTELTSSWIAFKLIGTNSNSQGIGAKVRVKANGKWQTREVAVLSSYRTQNSVLAHFGLGNAKVIDSVRVFWPSGKEQRIGRFPKINTNFTIREDVDYYDFTNAPLSSIVTDNYNTYSNSWVDYDKDGDLDALVGNVSGTNAINLYQNQGNNTFIDKVGTSLPGFDGAVYSSTWGDFDNDGDADLFATNNYSDKPNALYRNNGDGTLAKVGTGAILNETTYSQGSSWADYDNDGKLDMFVSNWHHDFPQGTNSLYKGNGTGGFSLVMNSVFANDKQVASHKMGWSDIDDDGDADLLVETVSLEKTLLYRNNGDGTFTKDLEWFNSSSNTHAIGAAFGDYDNDGDQDLYLSADRLYKNDGTGKFTQVTGLAFEGESSEAAIWGDVDNDGDLDLYLANGGGYELNSLYRNDGNDVFVKIYSFSTLDESNSRSAAFVDVNNDNHLDLFVGNIGMNKMFINNDAIYHGLQVSLDGVQSNGLGTGAKVKIRTGDKWQVREVFSQQSSNLRVHFGVGDVTLIDIVRVEWPSGNTQILKNVWSDQIIRLEEENTYGNDAATISPINITSNEDETVTFKPSDFKKAFRDGDGDKLEKIMVDTHPYEGKLFYNNVEIDGPVEIALADIGKLTFKPNANFTDLTAFMYMATDDRAGIQYGLVYLTIEPVNDAPTMSAIPDINAKLMKPGGDLEIVFTVFDTDNDVADLDISVESDDTDYAPLENFTLVAIGDNSRLYKFKTVRGGSTSITIRVSDGRAEVSRTFSMTINTAHSMNVNLEGNEDIELFLFTNPFKDTFVDNEDDVLKEIKFTALPKHGLLKFASMTVEWGQVIPAEYLNSLSYLPNRDFNGEDSFSYDASDTRGFSINFTSKITVKPLNDAPYIKEVKFIRQTVKAGETIEAELTLDDVDSPVDIATLRAVAENTNVAPEASMSFSGTGAKRTFKLKTKVDGKSKINLIVNDGINGSTKVIDVTVTPNTPISLDLDFHVMEDAVLGFTTADFTHVVDDPEDDELAKIILTKLPSHGTLVKSGSVVAIGNVLTTAELANLEYRPETNFNGDDGFEFDALDALDIAGASKATITVTPVNDAPTLSNVDDKTIDRLTIDDITTATVQMADIDNPVSGLTLTATADNSGVLSGITITGSGQSRTINMKVVKGGTATITIAVSDGLATTTKTFKLTVNSVVTGIDDLLSEQITIYPNPASERVTFDIDSITGVVSFEIFDNTGKMLRNGNVNEIVDVQDLAAGIYIVRFVTGDKIITRKLMKL